MFETVQILSTRNGSGPVSGYREDLAAGDVISLALTSYVAVTSVRWELVGRPSFSSAGGAGPEPVLLAVAPSASFTVDDDSGGVRRDGTYVVHAVINPGSPSEARRSVILARVSGVTITVPGGGARALRKTGGFEEMEDTSTVNRLQGWADQENWWKEIVRQLFSGGSSTTTLADAYNHGAGSGDQTLTLSDARGGGVVVDATGGGFTGASALRVNLPAGGPFVVDRATGRLGVGTATPALSVHAVGTSPGVRLQRTGGVSIDVQNVSDTLTFLNGATVLASMPPTGGVRADLGVGVGAAPATGPVLALGPANAVGVSSAGTGRLRYDEVTARLQFSVNGGPWTDFAAAGSSYGTIQNNGSPLTQRSILNFSGGAMVASDDPGNARTNVTLAFGTPADLGPNEAVAGAAATVLRSDALPGQKISAEWPIANLRYYALDGDLGSDANVGFSDTSAADAGTKAVATPARLNQILPIAGRGRSVVVLIKARSGGASYNDVTPFLVGRFGYVRFTVRGTVTDATANSVAFADDNADQVMCGAITATGMNAAGYNPTGTPTTSSIQLQLVGGGSPAFAAEPAIPLGARVRFGANAPTQAGLRGVVATVKKVTGADTIGLGVPLPVAPVSTDVVYIEMPGPLFNTSTQVSLDGANVGGNVPVVAGIRSSGTMQFNSGNTDVSFVWSSGNFFIGRHRWLSLHASLINAAGATVFVGAPRIGGTLNVSTTAFLANPSSEGATILGAVNLNRTGTFEFNWSQVVGAGIIALNHGNAIDMTTDSNAIGTIVQTTAGSAPVRVIGATSVSAFGGLTCAGQTRVDAIDFTNMASKPAIYVQGKACALYLAGPVTGSNGNNDVGLDLTATSGTTVIIGPLGNVTVTGALGDVRLSDGTIVTWAQAAAGIQDGAGNRLIGVSTPWPFRMLPTGASFDQLAAGGYVRALPGSGRLSVVPAPIADWTGTRTFLLDAVNGNDANPGYSDAAGPYTPATQAKQTAAGLQAVMPRNMGGRRFRLIIAAGTIGTADLDTLLGGLVGVGSGSLVRATGTGASAGASAFADDAADQVFLGAATATGCNAAGYNPTAGATTTVIPAQLVGGGAAGLAAEPASPLMWRLRFDAGTSTVALRNAARTVIGVSGGNTLTLDTALPATPSTSDTFYLEMPGLTYPSIRIGGVSVEPASTGGLSTGLQLVGLRTSGAMVIGSDWISMVFVGGASFQARSSTLKVNQGTYFEPVANVTRTPGGGLRSEASIIVETNEVSSLANLAAVTTGSFITHGQLLMGGVFGAGTISRGALVNQNNWSASQVGPVRVLAAGDVGGLELNDGITVGLSGIVITGCGAKPAINLKLSNDTLAVTNALSGSVGNNDVGLDVSTTSGSLILIASNPTVTGALGDIRLAGGSIVTWAQAAAGIIDSAGNRFIGGAWPFQVLPTGVFLTPLGTPGGPVVATAVTGQLQSTGFTTPPDIGPNEGVVGVATTMTRGDSIPGQKIQAAWPLATTRYYAIDGTNGNDSNAGFSDVSMAAAGSVAKRTIAGLAAIFPKNGAGRSAVIAILAGTYAEEIATLLNGVVGYATTYPSIRGTVTDATSGSVAFAGDAAEFLQHGFVTVSGLNAGGYNPTGTPTTTMIQGLKVGGGSPAYPGEPAAPLGWRVRFSSTTATAALRNVAMQIVQVSGGDTLTLVSALPATPTTSDIFYVEQAGVTLRGGVLETWAETQGPQVSGIAFSTTLRVSGNMSFSGVQTSLLTADRAILTIQSFVTNPGLTAFIGGGLVSAGALTFSDGASIKTFSGSANGAVVCRTNCQIWDSRFVNLLDGCAFGAGIEINGNSPSAIGHTTGTMFGGIPDIASSQEARVIGPGFGGANAGLFSRSGYLVLGKVSVTGVGSQSAIALKGANGVLNFQGLVRGSSGNNDVGLDLRLARNATVVFGLQGAPMPTVTGALGDVRLADGTIITWAQAAAGVQDSAGNRLIGATWPLRILPTGVFVDPLNAGGWVTADAGTGHLSLAPFVPQARVFADGVSAVGTIRLSTVDAAPYPEGTVAWVASVGDFFRLTQSALTTQATTVVTAFNKSGYQWIRLGIPNRQWWAVTAWGIDPVSGNDENVGSVGSPLATWSEWANRTREMVTGNAITVSLLSDTPDADTIAVRFDALVLTINGTVSVSSTQTVASAQAYDSSLNRANEITVTGFDFTPFLNRLVRVQGTQRYGAILKITGANSCRVSQMFDFSTSGTSQIIAGDTIEIVQQTKGPAGFSQEGRTPVNVNDIRIEGTGSTFIKKLGGDSGLWKRCVIGGTTFTRQRGSFGDSFQGCHWKNTGLTNFATSGDVFQMCSFSSQFVAFSDGFVKARSLTLQGAYINVNRVRVEIDADLGTFDLPAATNGINFLSSETTSTVMFNSGRHYGSGNSASASVWSICPMGMVFYSSATPPTMDAGLGVLVNGGTYTLAQLPAQFDVRYGSGAMDGAGPAAVLDTRTISTVLPLTGGGALSGNLTFAINDFVGSGLGHARGAVPDPGAVAGTTRFLREDGTWAAPPGGGGGTVTSVTASLPLAYTGTTSVNITLNYDAASITLNGSNQIQRAALTGDVTAGAGSNATAFRSFAATSVLARAAASPGVPTELSSGGNGQVLQQAGGVLTFAALAYSSLTGTPTLWYQTMAGSGSAVTQRPTLNFAQEFSVADNAGSNRTDVSLTFFPFVSRANNAPANAVNLGLQPSGVMQLSVSGSVAAASMFVAGAARIPFGGGAVGGGLTDDAHLKFNGQTFGLGSIEEVQVYNDSTSTTALTGYRVGLNSTFSNGSLSFAMTGTGWTPGSGLVASQGMLELSGVAGKPLTISAYDGSAGADINLTTTSSRVVRLQVQAGGSVVLSSLAAGGMVKAAAGGALSLAVSGTDFQAPISWPAAGRVLVSTGSAPTGDSLFTFDTATHTLSTSTIKFGDGTNVAYLYGIATATVSATAQFWKDATPSKAVGFGNGVPGAAPTDDVHVCTYSAGPGWVDRLTISNSTGAVTVATLGSGLVKASSGTLGIAVVGTDLFYQSIAGNGSTTTQRGILNFNSAFAVTDNAGSSRTDVALVVPTTDQVAYSDGTKLVGDSNFTFDTATHQLRLGASGTQAWFNLLSGGNFERILAFWVSNVWTIFSQAGGSGTTRSIAIDSNSADTTIQPSGGGSSRLGGNFVTINSSPGGNVSIAATDGTNVITWPTLTFRSANLGQPSIVVDTHYYVDSAANQRMNAFAVGGTGSVLIRGTTNITSPFGIAAFFQHSLVAQNGALTISNAATVYIEGAPLGGGLTISNPYAIWVDDGVARFDGSGSIVFELPADATGNTSAATGRVPIRVGGVTKYLRYFDS